MLSRLKVLDITVSLLNFRYNLCNALFCFLWLVHTLTIKPLLSPQGLLEGEGEGERA